MRPVAIALIVRFWALKAAAHIGTSRACAYERECDREAPKVSQHHNIIFLKNTDGLLRSAGIIWTHPERR